MAGTISSDGKIWNVGDTTAKNNAGGTAAIPGDNATIIVSTAVPTASPDGLGISLNSATNRLYVWDGDSWVAASGANT